MVLAILHHDLHCRRQVVIIQVDPEELSYSKDKPLLGHSADELLYLEHYGMHLVSKHTAPKVNADDCSTLGMPA